MNKQKIIKAGEIAKQVRKEIPKIVKKDKLLLEIAEEIESKIISLGGAPAFPTNLSINEIAAHYTPTYNDETKANGLLKIDFGVHIDGWTSDTAITIDLEDSQENKNLIQATEQALEKALETINENIEISKIGKAIEDSVKEKGFIPIVNLSGHSMEEYDLHAGLTIPNFDNSSNQEIEPGLYAIEPFATLPTASGKVKDGKPSGIYMLVEEKNIRSPIAREILEYIEEEHGSLPFCSRWLIKKFGTKALFALKQLETNGNLHHFPQLVESSGAKVAQAEHTILISKKEKIITTKN